MQNPSPYVFPNRNMSEDCLSINVFTPPYGGPTPVMVYINGGAFNNGDSASYNASQLASMGFGSWGNLMWVTFNYRVGPFGFLAQSDLQQQGLALQGSMA